MCGIPELVFVVGWVLFVVDSIFQLIDLRDNLPLLRALRPLTLPQLRSLQASAPSNAPPLPPAPEGAAPLHAAAAEGERGVAGERAEDAGGSGVEREL